MDRSAEPAREEIVYVHTNCATVLVREGEGKQTRFFCPLCKHHTKGRGITQALRAVDVRTAE